MFDDGTDLLPRGGPLWHRGGRGLRHMHRSSHVRGHL